MCVAGGRGSFGARKRCDLFVIFAGVHLVREKVLFFCYFSVCGGVVGGGVWIGIFNIALFLFLLCFFCILFF